MSDLVSRNSNSRYAECQQHFSLLIHFVDAVSAGINQPDVVVLVDIHIVRPLRFGAWENSEKAAVRLPNG